MNEDKTENTLENLDNQTNLKEGDVPENDQPENAKNLAKKNDTFSEEKSDEDESKLENLESVLEETKDKLLRVLAENENVRKQAERNRIDTIKYGVQPLARELVNVVDNFERALNSVEDISQKKALEGFELIQKEILQILDKFSIKKIDALGQTFDANLHQAMFEKPTKEFSPGLVCEIVQDGYTFHDRLLRPAMVGIAKENVQKNEEENILAKKENILPEEENKKEELKPKESPSEHDS